MRRYDRGRASVGEGVMALAGVESTLSGFVGVLPVGQNLVQRLGRHGGIAHVAGGKLGGPDIQGPTPKGIMREAQRFVPLCLRALPSLSILILVPLIGMRNSSSGSRLLDRESWPSAASRDG